jgi:hypothetical protein
MQNLVDLGSAHDASRAMLAKAESDMTSQHLPLCCLRRVSYCKASLPLSIKIFFFFKLRQDAPFFFLGLLASAFHLLSTSQVPCSLYYHQARELLMEDI